MAHDVNAVDDRFESTSEQFETWIGAPRPPSGIVDLTGPVGVSYEYTTLRFPITAGGVTKYRPVRYLQLTSPGCAATHLYTGRPSSYSRLRALWQNRPSDLGKYMTEVELLDYIPSSCYTQFAGENIGRLLGEGAEALPVVPDWMPTFAVPDMPPWMVGRWGNRTGIVRQTDSQNPPPVPGNPNILGSQVGWSTAALFNMYKKTVFLGYGTDDEVGILLQNFGTANLEIQAIFYHSVNENDWVNIPEVMSTQGPTAYVNAGQKVVHGFSPAGHFTGMRCTPSTPGTVIWRATPTMW